MIKRLIFHTRSLKKILRWKVLLYAGIFTAILVSNASVLHGQTLKFRGGTHDGSCIWPVFSGSLSGAVRLHQKYQGRFFDGSVHQYFPPGSLDGRLFNYARYNGGSYDGNKTLSYGAGTFGGGHLLAAKYNGLSFDGAYANTFLPAMLNGNYSLLSKYNGGSRDGAVFLLFTYETPGGVMPVTAKFRGAGYDGYDKRIGSNGNMAGILPNTAKYNGLGFDGAFCLALAPARLGGGYASADKYNGGSFEGASILGFIPGRFNGSIVSLIRYNGGRNDGYVSSALIPQPMLVYSGKFFGGSRDGVHTLPFGTGRMSGAMLTALKYNGASRDGFTFVTTVRGRPSGVTPLAGKYNGGMRDGYTSDSIWYASPPVSLNLAMLLEGLYDANTNLLTASDTIRVSLKSDSSPYSELDYAYVIPQNSGSGSAVFRNAGSGNYFIVVNHRNSIETWSSNGIGFTAGSVSSYDFTASASKAFGNNLKLKGGKYVIYSGDVNQDGVIDFSDMRLIDNASAAGSTGVVAEDLNGDRLVDYKDILLADDNSLNYVKACKPTAQSDKSLEMPKEKK